MNREGYGRTRSKTFFSWLLLILGCSQVIKAAPPDSGSLVGDILMTAEHGNEYFDEEEMLNGIWRFDPDSGSFTRLRPFYATRQQFYAYDIFHGDEGNLAVDQDRLVYQSWPYQSYFDLFSWRMLNRVPTPDPDSGLGWVLQGTILGIAEAGRDGLSPGTFGFARCVLDDVTRLHQLHPRSCEPLSLPDGFGTIFSSDGHDAFFSGESPADPGEMRFFALFPEMWYSESHTLSFDGERGGFWKTDDEGSSFFPVVDGQLQQSSLRLDFDFEPFSGDNGVVGASYYHPASHRLYTLGFHIRPDTGRQDERYLFSIDPDTGEKRDYAFPEISRPTSIEFLPVSMTSLHQLPSKNELLIPIIAETPGRNGTDWSTDLWLYNPSEEVTRVELRRITRPDTVITLDLEAHESRKIEGILSWVGGGAVGDGTKHDALRISSDYRWGAQLVAIARISTTDPETAGSFGHVVTAVPYPWGYSNHGSYSKENDELLHVLSAGLGVAHFDLDLREPGRFRYNLGLVNSTSETLSIELLWGFNEVIYYTYQDHHPEGSRVRVEVDPHSVRIVDLVALFPRSISSTWPPRIGVFGDRPFPVWISMVDQKTGDATFVPYSNFHHDGRGSSWNGHGVDPEFRQAIPVVARTGGKNQSLWTTDLYGYLGDDGNAVADVIFPYLYPAPDRPNSCGEDAPTDGFLLEALDAVFPSDLDAWIEESRRCGFPYYPAWAVTGWRTIFPDIVASFPECADAGNTIGGLEIETGSWFSGFSRTYTTREDGGTYGSMLPLYPPHGWPIQHFAGIEVGEENRVNVGFYNGDHEHEITHRIFLYSADGELFAETEFVLQSTGSKLVSIETLFGKSIPPGTYGMTVLPLDGVDEEEDVYEGHSWAYVSVIDNRTNDPINLW